MPDGQSQPVHPRLGSRDVASFLIAALVLALVLLVSYLCIRLFDLRRPPPCGEARKNEPDRTQESFRLRKLIK